MQHLENLSGDKPTRVYISTLNNKVLAGVTDEKDTLRTPCRKGYAMKIEGKWRETTRDGRIKERK